VSDAQNSATDREDGEDSPQERYWQDAAASITTGMILQVCYAAAAEVEKVSRRSRQGIHAPRTGIQRTAHELRNYPTILHAGMVGGSKPASRRDAPCGAGKSAGDARQGGQDFSGVLSTAKTALTLYSDPLVSRNTAASDFTINDW